MKTIPILGGWVELDQTTGAVHWKGEVIGHVSKGWRYYSPPTHRGSTIAKYHKKVKCWKLRGHHRISFDTRKAAIEYLIRNG